MKDFSEKIIETIKKEKITPEPRWKLNYENYFFWLVFVLIIMLGALFFSLIILNIADIGPELFHYLKIRKFMFLIFQTMPYLWIILLLVAVFSGFMVFRKTKKGYRYNILFVASVVVLAIFFFGFIVHLLKINNRIEKGMPGPRNIIFPIEKRWQKPEEGLLGGEIFEVGEKVFFIKTPKGEEWGVSYSEKTKFKKGVRLEETEKVGVIGEKISDRFIEALVVIKIPLRGECGECLEKEKFSPCF